MARIFVLMLILANCGGGGGSKVYVAPNYKKQFAIDADLVIVALRPPTIIYRGDALKSLREVNKDNLTDSAALIQRYFYSQLLRDIEREVDIKSVTIAGPPRRYLVTKEVVKTADATFTVEIPDGNARLIFDHSVREPALVLFLDHIRVGTVTDPYYADRAQHGVYTTAARRLAYAMSFVLWDNRELKYICYGRVNSITSISGEEASIADWEEVSRDIVRQIFEVTGFLKQSS